MPYKTNADLPIPVKENLPIQAQTVYRKAFNSAYEEYKDPEKRRRASSNLDEVAARVAWSAVKKGYKKGAKGWQKK